MILLDVSLNPNFISLIFLWIFLFDENLILLKINKEKKKIEKILIDKDTKKS
jgi:hypothetical protein